MLRKNVKLLLEQFQVCIFAEIVFGVRCTLIIGSLHDPVTWCKITYTGEQVDSGTSKTKAGASGADPRFFLGGVHF